MKLTILVSVALLGILVAGCGSADPVTTKKEEEMFHNPDRPMPAAAAEGMKKGAEEARKKAEEQNRAAQTK